MHKTSAKGECSFFKTEKTKIEKLKAVQRKRLIPRYPVRTSDTSTLPKELTANGIEVNKITGKKDAQKEESVSVKNLAKGEIGSESSLKKPLSL